MGKQTQGIKYVQPREEYFEIPGVSYRGEVGTYRLFEKMAPSMTQDQLAEFYETEKQKGRPHPTDAPLIIGIIFSGYDSRDESPEEAGKLRNFLYQTFRQYPNNLTRPVYNPDEQDEIIHNYGTSDLYSLRENLVGPDGFIQAIPDKNVLEALLGTKDVNKLNKVFQWFNKTNGFLFRLNSKPLQKDKRFVRFSADSDRVGLNCGRYPSDRCPAFLVERVK